MLLNAFARYEGLSYLGQSLSEPLRKVLPFIDQCEIDPHKLPPPKRRADDDGNLTNEERSEAQIEENRERLTEACLVVLTSIVERRDKMPASMRRMCAFLRTTVDEIYKEIGYPAPPSPPAARQRTPSQPSALSGGGGSAGDLGAAAPADWGSQPATATRMSASPSVMDSKKISAASIVITSPVEAARPDSPARRSVSALSTASARSQEDETEKKSEGFRFFGLIKVKSKGTGLSGASSPGSRSGSLGSIESLHKEAPSSQDAGVQKRKVSGRRGVPHESIVSWPNTKKVDEASTEPHPIPDSPLARTRTDSLASIATVMTVGGSRVQRSVGMLTIAEKVVGSFLFLRFLVPAITAPDGYGLVETKVSPQARRGLVLCGKVLTAICNDVEFGRKESYLMPLNAFLREHRAGIKELLLFVADEARKSPMSPHPLASDPTDGRPPVPRRGSMLSVKPGLPTSRSEPTLNKLLATAPPRSLPRSHSQMFADTDNLFNYVGRSLNKIEHDLEEQLASMPSDEGEGVLANFYDLKKLVEASAYWEGAEEVHGAGKSKSGALFAKLGKLRGLFQ
ncbi:hypothetical protein BDK51DRAFT_39007 [Blyttiomyces helicus]|uniref:Ras-GAP domain-containing protein n=1 Tax=Blyttiomyces helicus TaxID=388810 RepID=A0A4P9W241_9FUNG|nr:hypothetical protein BDK51DRAFT_39007 [Blyttiomyces helicus]|eukprot:RKO84838.1 hypothetical protein BDK51DRAFT_39007 [Blyttiomyces helicus]